MTKERAAKIILDMINGAESTFGHSLSTTEIIALKKAYCALNPEPKTNADRIRSMTDEELAEYLFERGNGDEYCYGICVHQDDVNACVKTLKQNGCIQSVVAWLKQEASDD